MESVANTTPRPVAIPSAPNGQSGAPIAKLPKDIILHIFNMLLPEDLACVSGVCREWRIAANDRDMYFWKHYINKLFPSLRVIDRTVWERCVDLNAFGLSFEDAEPFNERRVAIQMSKLCRCVAETKIENNAGWTLFELPKGLGLNKLVAVALFSKQGNKAPCRHTRISIFEQFGEGITSKTHQFIITNNVLEKSRELFFNAHRELVEKTECEMPGFLEVASLTVLTHMNSPADSPTYLYPVDPLTYTRCHTGSSDIGLAFGGFSPPNDIGSGGWCISHFGLDSGNGNVGVAALKKFEAVGL